MAFETLGKATYVASGPDQSWLQSEQRKLYERSWNHPDYVFEKLWGLVTDPRNLRIAVGRVAGNRGHRTAGVDGITVRKILERIGLEAFVTKVRDELRSGTYRPSPARRVLIPKPGKPGEFRPLGIPTVKDRVIQAAVKNIIEPIFEGDFYPVSYGFRPGRSAWGALAHLKMLMLPRGCQKDEAAKYRLPYQWAIEGDIKGCFDNIDHHALMVRFRRRIADTKVNRLVLAFLKAGVLTEEQFARTQSGTPQGGILSPLLANIALSAIEERYERHVWPRRTPTPTADTRKIGLRAENARAKQKKLGRVLFFPIRYADDFIILVCAPPGPDQDDRARAAAIQEKTALAEFLKDKLGLDLSEGKTLVTSVTQPMKFLGHHIRVCRHPRKKRMVSRVVIPKDRSQRLRNMVKALFRQSTTGASLANRLEKLNPILRGWVFFYRHAWGAKSVFHALDLYVWWTIFRWAKKKHHRTGYYRLKDRYGGGNRRGFFPWQDGQRRLFRMDSVPVTAFRLAWMRKPSFVPNTNGEPDA